MHQRILQTIAATVWAPALAFLGACTNVVGGGPTYATETPSDTLPLVKSAQLPSLILSPAEIGAIMHAPDLAVVDSMSALNRLPDGALSDLHCAPAIVPGEESTYRGSGYQGAQALLFVDPDAHTAGEYVTAFGDAPAAQALVKAATNRWKDCSGKVLTLTLGDAPTNWTISDPGRSNGVAVVLRRLEGGQGHACSRAIAARSNIVADVLVCGDDENLANDQAATVVNSILAKIPH